MSRVTFNPIIYDGLTFTNIAVTQTVVGQTSPYMKNPGAAGGVKTVSGAGIEWGGAHAGAYYADSSQVLNFDYTVSTGSASTLIDSIGQLYVSDEFSGPGVSLIAVENVYTTSGVLVGTETFTAGQPNVAAIALKQYQETLNVQVTVTMAVDSTGTSDSAIFASEFQQTFGQIAAPQPATITGTAFLDVNRNGIDDAGDSAMSGVTVELLNATTTSVLATTTTSSSGAYGFTALAPGTYEVAFVKPAADIFTTQGASFQSTDSSANVITGLTAPIALTAGKTQSYVNAGFQTPVNAISGIVWLDSNHDGLDDNNASGVAGVTVDLLGASGTGFPVPAVTTTDSTGAYSFAGLNPGSYEIELNPSGGDGFTTQGVTSTAYLNSAVNPTTGIAGPATLDAGSTITTLNAGLVLTAPGISILKLPSTPVVGSAGQVTYTFDLTNTGTTPLTNIVVSDNTGSVTKPMIVMPKLTTPAPAGYLGAGQTLVYTEIVNEPYIASIAGTISGVASGIHLTAGCTVWLASTFKPTSTDDGATYTFAGVTCSVIGPTVPKPVSVACPTSVVTFSSSCKSATTVFDAATNTWVTTLPANSTPGNVFLTGAPLAVPAGANLANTTVQWTCGTATNNVGQSSLAWSGSLTGFSNTNPTDQTSLTNYNLIGVKPSDNLAGAGGDPGGAGTAENLLVGCISKAPPCATSATLTCNATPVEVVSAADTVRVTASAVAATLTTTAVTTPPGGGNLTSGCTAWLSSVFKPTSTANGASYSFSNITCQIAGAGMVSPIGVTCANATITFSSSCTTPTTVYNPSTNTWITTLPANSNPGDVFLTGAPVAIPSGDTLANATATWTIGGSSNNTGASSVAIGGSLTGYKSFDVNNCNGMASLNAIGVKSCDTLGAGGGAGITAAGTPENECAAGNYSLISSSTTTIPLTGTCSATPATVTASDTKEIQVLATGTDITVNGPVPAGSLTAPYGTAQTLEFLYNPGNAAGAGQVSGTNSATTAYMAIENAARTSIYFEGAVAAGEDIQADATINPLTGTAVAGGHFSTTAGADIIAMVFSSQASFQAASAPTQTMTYNTSGSQPMQLGDTIGSLRLVGYVGATGGHLVT